MCRYERYECVEMKGTTRNSLESKRVARDIICVVAQSQLTRHASRFCSSAHHNNSLDLDYPYPVTTYERNTTCTFHYTIIMLAFRGFVFFSLLAMGVSAAKHLVELPTMELLSTDDLSGHDGGLEDIDMIQIRDNESGIMKRACPPCYPWLCQGRCCQFNKCCKKQCCQPAANACTTDGHCRINC